MELKLKPYARLAAIGAVGVSGGSAAIFLLLAWFTRSTPLGGIDGTQSILTLVSLAIPFALIIAVHVVCARVLFQYARE
jgi:hypothetical protein